MEQVMKDTSNYSATGKVMKALGNLIQVEFEGDIRQGEVVTLILGDLHLKGETLEISGNQAKVQVFEDIRGVKLGSSVIFLGGLLEAELGPGLLTSIFDGLQNPLVKVAEKADFFLPRGVYLAPLDREKKWRFEPLSKIGDVLVRGDALGSTLEERFTHFIMIPFTLYGKYQITWMIAPGLYTVDTVVAKGVDETGKEHSFTMLQKWPIKAPLMEGVKDKSTKMMDTGERIIDTQFPLMKGGTFCIPGPFGAGKTVLQHHLSKYSSVDLVVFIACGERAGEVVEVLQEFPHLTDPHTGQPLMTRTVIICNTSSMPVAARESSIYMGITIGEYYRQMGLDVLVLADSTSRWAQALREMSGRLEEIPGEEAFPAYLSSRIAEFYERSGVVNLRNGSIGSITIGGAVSPPGGNFEEPVTQATLLVVRAFLGLEKKRSDSRRYPAISPYTSWSKDIVEVGLSLEKEVENWSEMVNRASHFLKEGHDIEIRMEVIGEEGTSLEDIIIYEKKELYENAYLQQNAFDAVDAYCPLKRQIPLFILINNIFETHFDFNSKSQAKRFFLGLRNQIKNMNSLIFESEAYHKALKEVKATISKHKSP